MSLTIHVQRVGQVEVPLPSYQTPGSAGLDLHAAVQSPLTLAPGCRHLVPTGLALAIPPGFEGQVRPRSGLALRHGISLVNSPGTIDSDYRGEVAVIVINHGTEPVVIRPLERVAQLVITRVEQAQLVVVGELDATARGAGGYGSTGS